MRNFREILTGHGDDFSEGDHREYVENSTLEIALIGGLAILLIGGFVASLA